ncbi:hypothetical protein APY03_5436 [Variovorax sp. WDL1]|nr:hypothetical protein APY03_5436 [Variovorax sp. WDL1]
MLPCAWHDPRRMKPRSRVVKHRGTGFAGPLMLPPEGGWRKRHEVRAAWG